MVDALDGITEYTNSLGVCGTHYVGSLSLYDARGYGHRGGGMCVGVGRAGDAVNKSRDMHGTISILWVRGDGGRDRGEALLGCCSGKMR